ncbi:MAG TPA: hypothetical protein VJC03_04630, partial [bacterium]|nr:hypothetical protein [bacterium]
MKEFKDSVITKVISLALAFFIFFSFCFSEYAQAVSVQTQIKDWNNSGLPLKYGKMVETYKGKFPGKVAIVQDVHAHAEAQENISRILGHLSSGGKIKTVALEGNWKEVNTALLSTIPDTKIRDTVSSSLMDRGFVSGAEHFGVNSGEKIKLQGVENRALYEKARSILEGVMKEQEYIKTVTEPVRQDLSRVRKKALNSDLRAFSDEKNLIEKTDRYVLFLLEWARKLELNIDKYPALADLLNVFQLKDSIDFSKVEGEIELFLKKLALVLPAEKTGVLRAMRSSPENAEKFYRVLKELYAKHQTLLKPQECRNLALFFEYVDI